MQKSHAVTLMAVIGGFAVYFINVVVGAAGGAVFLSDVGEMLMLFATCVCFVIFVLQREHAARSGDRIKQ